MAKKRRRQKAKRVADISRWNLPETTRRLTDIVSQKVAATVVESIKAEIQTEADVEDSALMKAVLGAATEAINIAFDEDHVVISLYAADPMEILVDFDLGDDCAAGPVKKLNLRKAVLEWADGADDKSKTKATAAFRSLADQIENQ